MLLELEVKNFALIDELRIEFDKGLNILTGETGAGKSIIIDAVNMAIGERADREFVRTGTNKCIIQAVFSKEGISELENIFNEYGIDGGEESILVVTREIYSNGRSVSRINGTVVTQTVLKLITEKLIDIHGQHEHQSLLNSNFHIDLLDAYGGKEINDVLQVVSAKYTKLTSLEKILSSICSSEMEREKRIDLLKFQIQEIDAAKLKIGEEEELNQQRTLLANSEKIYNVIAKSYASLYEADYQSSILDNISKIVNELHGIATFDGELSHYHEVMEDIQYKIQDVSREMRRYRDQIDFDPGLLQEIEKRLDVINNLKRKYGTSIKEILEYRDKIYKELELYENSKEEIERLNNAITQQKSELQDLSLKLSKLRKEAALSLERELVTVLKELNMGKTSFKVDIKQVKDSDDEFKFSSKGIDEVEFMISTNLGEPLKSLSKIASGGEMSRIMLALKTILAYIDHIPCLIFDEIDTGVSGRTAQVVGDKLYHISTNHQVICITHLPQIACMADAHYLIEKKEASNSTKTIVKKLDHTKRIYELGRLLGGELTEITLKHAEEMIQQAYLKRKA